MESPGDEASERVLQGGDVWAEIWSKWGAKSGAGLWKELFFTQGTAGEGPEVLLRDKQRPVWPQWRSGRKRVWRARQEHTGPHKAMMGSPSSLSQCEGTQREGWSQGVRWCVAQHCLLDASLVPGTTFPHKMTRSWVQGYRNVFSGFLSQERAEAGAAAHRKLMAYLSPGFSPPGTHLLPSTPQSPAGHHCHWWLHRYTFPCPRQAQHESKGWKSPGYHSPAGSGPHWWWVVRFCAMSLGALGSPGPSRKRRKGESLYIRSTSYVSSIVLGTLHVLIHIILISSMWNKYYFRLHFRDEEIEMQSFGRFLEALKIESGQVRHPGFRAHHTDVSQAWLHD